MSVQFTREQLNNIDKSMLIDMFLQMQGRFDELDSELKKANDNTQKILEQLVLAKKARFGRSSEKMSDHTPGQLAFMEVEGEFVLFNEAEVHYDPDLKEPEDLVPVRKPKQKGKREEDMKDIPAERKEHYLTEEELTEIFGENGWKRLPDMVTKKYEFHQAKITVCEHHVGVYASNKDDRIVRAPHPKWLLPSSPVSASVASAVINGKYVNSVTFYRLEREFERYGLSITRANMANWMIRISEEYLSIYYEYLHKKFYGYHVIQADETPFLVNKDGRPANSKSYMWVYRTGYLYEHPIILYQYQKTRNTSHPREFLKDFSGICMTDGYQVYHSLEKEREDLRIAGCFIHMRRRFNDALALIPKQAQKGTAAYLAMKQIQAIYREEGKLKDMPSEERLMQRQAVIKPLVDAFFAYIKESSSKPGLSSKLKEAISYAINQERYLRVFLEDGDVPMDNNASERSIRSFCIGKKNFVMIDTIHGAQSSAVIYSLVETAKANDLKPYEFFVHLLTELPKLTDMTSSEAEPYLEKLLPWSPELPAHIRKPVKSK